MFAVFAGFLALLQVFVGPLRQGRFVTVPIKAYGRNLLRKNTILFSTMIFMIGLHWGVEGTVYSPFLKNNLGLTTMELSLYVSLSLLALAFSALLIGRIPFDLRLNKRLFEKDSIGGSSALLLAVMTTGQMAGALIFSSMGYRYGLIYPFIAAGTLLTLNAGFARFCFRRAKY
jgi:hypothetical protein